MAKRSGRFSRVNRVKRAARRTAQKGFAGFQAFASRVLFSGGFLFAVVAVGLLVFWHHPAHGDSIAPILEELFPDTPVATYYTKYERQIWVFVLAAPPLVFVPTSSYAVYAVSVLMTSIFFYTIRPFFLGAFFIVLGLVLSIKNSGSRVVAVFFLFAAFYVMLFWGRSGGGGGGAANVSASAVPETVTPRSKV